MSIDYSLGAFKTRAFPYVFAAILLGALSYGCFTQAFTVGPTQVFAQYFLIIFGGFWVIFVYLFINNYTELIIYPDKLTLQLVFLSTHDEILFSEVDTVKSQNRVIFHEDNPADNYLLIAGSSRNSSLQFLMKDGQKLEISLNDYTESEEILKLLKQTTLNSSSDADVVA